MNKWPMPGQIWRNKRSGVDLRIVGETKGDEVHVEWPSNKVQYMITLTHLDEEWYLHYEDQVPQKYIENPMDALEKILNER